MSKHVIYFKDARKMDDLKDSSIDLIVTSPPYFDLKDYGHPNQIGFNQTYEEYLLDLEKVFSECFRVLKEGRRICINIGDKFASTKETGEHQIIPIHADLIKLCQKLSFIYMGSIIWEKINTCRPEGGASIMGSYPYPPNGMVKIDYEFILIFKKPGKLPKFNKELKEKSKMTLEEWTSFFSSKWSVKGLPQKNGHGAVFPVEIPYRLIKMFSFLGETVLDPFLGTGTTSYAAFLLNRNSVGYEINPDFKNIILSRFPTLFVEEFQFPDSLVILGDNYEKNSFS